MHMTHPHTRVVLTGACGTHPLTRVVLTRRAVPTRMHMTHPLTQAVLTRIVHTDGDYGIICA